MDSNEAIYESKRLSPLEALDVWPLVRADLKAALEHGEGETPLEVHMQRVLSGHSTIWIIVKDNQEIVGVALTQTLFYHTHKTLHIVAVGGREYDKWFHHYERFKEAAKAEGCKAIEQWGREGWVRHLKKRVPSMRVAYTVMRDDL